MSVTTYPIVVDIRNADVLANLNTGTYQALVDQANRGLALFSSLTGNQVFMDSLPTFELVYLGYRDYQADAFSASFSAQYAGGSLGTYYGSRSSYYGNLRGLYWVSATPPMTITYDTMIIAAKTIYSNQIPTLSGGSTVYYPVSTIEYLVEQFEFINKYLWADPTNLALSGNLTDAYMKFGIKYNATSLLRVASANVSDQVFYTNKKKYLTGLL